MKFSNFSISSIILCICVLSVLQLQSNDSVAGQGKIGGNSRGQDAVTPAGGQYLGPPDVVPPNVPPPPPGGCAYGRPASCSLNPILDPVDAPAVPYFPFMTWQNVPVDFGCAKGTGDVAEITVKQLGPALYTALTQGKDYIDITFQGTQAYENIYFYPIKGLQLYCLQEQVFSLYSGCNGHNFAAQIPQAFDGSPAPWEFYDCNGSFPFPVNHGFFQKAQDGCDVWEDYLAQNDFCVSDHDQCSDQVNKLFGITVRIPASCLSGISFELSKYNPGYLTPDTVLFSIVGNYCTGV